MAERRRTDAFIPLRALTVPQLTPEATLAEIRRLYFQATDKTIERDLAQAIALLARLESEHERERATVYMEGLVEMRKEWAREARKKRRPATRRKGTPKR